MELDRRARRRTVRRSASLLTLPILLASCSASGGLTTSPPPPTMSAPPAAVLVAVEQARTEGTVSGTVEWIESTSRSVAALSHDGPGSPDVPVYVVQLHGHFVLDSAPRPSLAAGIPSGTDLVLFVPIPNDDNGGAGVRLADDKVDLSPYGAVQTFQPS